MSNNKSQFGLGIIIGATLGALAGMFVAPKSGKEMRKGAAKKIKNIQHMYAGMSDESIKLYKQARSELIKKIDSIKDEIDDEKYANLVNEVIEQVKKRADTTKEMIIDLKDQLMAEWSDGAQDIADAAKATKRKK